MAEDAANNTGNRKVRVVKKAESVRQMAEKNSKELEAKAPGVVRLTLRYIGAPFRVIGRPIAKVSHKQPFKFIGHVLWPAYFRNSWKELRQVTWPNRRESRQLTTAVIIFATIFGVLIAIVDFGLDRLFKQVLLK